MNADSNLFFIKDRINEIGSALLYSMSNELVKVPCSIITVLDADDKGHLWFFTSRPGQYMSKKEKSFPATLKFYRKGKPFFVEVSGHATVTENKELINEYAGMVGKSADTAMENLMLVKLKMNKAEYHEPKPLKTAESFIAQLKEFVMNLIKPSYNYRAFEINPEIV